MENKFLDTHMPVLFYQNITDELEYDSSMDKIKLPFNPSGQLKLFISELRFFTRIFLGDKLLTQDDDVEKITIVYIGSAPGTHILILMDLFQHEKLHWVLFDSVQHDSRLSKRPNVTIYKKFATTSFLKELHPKLVKSKKDKLYLISDIRTTDKRGDEPNTKNLLADYKLQNGFLEVLKPNASLLKWRCPFPDDWIEDFEIPEGEEWLQAFAQPTSAEMRLMVEPDPTKKYAIKYRRITKEMTPVYERRLCYFNQLTRHKQYTTFNHPFPYNDFLIFHYVLKHANLVNLPEFLKNIYKRSIHSFVYRLEEYIFKRLNVSPN